MRTSTVLPLVLVAASTMAPAFARPLTPTEAPTTAAPTEPAHTTSVQTTTEPGIMPTRVLPMSYTSGAHREHAYAHTGYRGQHTHQKAGVQGSHRVAGERLPQRGSTRLQGANRYAGQRRPQRAAVAARPRSAGQHRHHLQSQPSDEEEPSQSQGREPEGRSFAKSQHVAREFDEEIFARELANELVARKVNWKKVGNVVGDVGKVALKFLPFKREDGELSARDFDEELFARALEEELANREVEDDLVARKVNWKKVGNVVGDVAKTALHFIPFKREDAELYERGVEFDDGVVAREAPVQGSGAISFKNILHDGEQFIDGVLRREDEELLARAFEEELMARGMELDELD
ncbi:hypothetical protein DAEQUDRAFT_740613 [Daedalea quercina L-15889]|uniref:Uncharacterized protein n=1 Tax=Daedalea quercina L-15889 TaxID=1314783 RepID=A0A165MDC5_9APHY|nr:hypothetical protein DAEQUDRAFT_740613 [Daedalea quercina L-15889]